MLKANSTQVKENIRSYIINNFEPYSGEENTPHTFKEIANYIMDAFYNEKIMYDKRKLTHQEYFVEWCQGLPSVLDTCYYYNRSAVEDLGNIFEQTEEERNKYTERQAEHRLTCMIYAELVKAVK